MDDAVVTPDQIEGVICCDSHIAGGSGGSASQWAPRPYFAPPYDAEWGSRWSMRSGSSKRCACRLPNVKFAPTGVLPSTDAVDAACDVRALWRHPHQPAALQHRLGPGVALAKAVLGLQGLVENASP
jgi:hypothetical protein